MTKDRTIVRAAIHPAIGVARVGNSRDAFFIGPEVADQPALPQGEYKDKYGALKRQAARFRIYGHNSAGDVVAELTSHNADVNWTVHLANKKSVWYEFYHAFDIAEASGPGAPVTRRRNPQVTGTDRKSLIIDSGNRSISGKDTMGDAYRFNSGKFMNISVDLGELRTDDHGRLLVLGGFGKSQSIAGLPPLDFANNDGWYDDISDGPVDATVTIDGQTIPVQGAWVVVAPPNYAPILKTVRTLYDVLFHLGLRSDLHWYKSIERPSFKEHIEPIFRRLSDLQWVNQGFAAVFGIDAPYEATRLNRRLSDASNTNKEFRQQIFSRFRVPGDSRSDASLWPYFYGDGIDNPQSATSMATLTSTQYRWLRQWSEGDYEVDAGVDLISPKSLDEIAIDLQPDALDRAALDFCLADAFHPGCEFTWIMRRPSLYSGRLRLRRRPPQMPESDYGDILTSPVVLSPNGPLSMSAAGDLTRWMAVPWQTDTASCLSGYSFFKTTDSLPTFWPARVPNQVLAESDYLTLMDDNFTDEQRIEAFRTRRDWFRGFVEKNDIVQMITDFHKLGIVEERAGPANLPHISSRLLVESQPDFPPLPQVVAGGLAAERKVSPAEQPAWTAGYALRQARSNCRTPDNE